MDLTTALIWLLSYLLGSIPFGVVLARIKNIDLRSHGSGNIGATNVTRTLGKTAGLLTLLGDGGKGYLACWVAGRNLTSDWGIGIAALLAFLGHVFSIFLKFRGGKGIATGLGIYLCLMPLAGLSALALFILTLLATGYVSVSSMLAAVAVPVFAWVYKAPNPYLVIAMIAGAVTLFKHRENIQRLRAGTENRFRKK